MHRVGHATRERKALLLQLPSSRLEPCTTSTEYTAGSGGFHERHPVGTGVADLPASFPGLPGVTLESFRCREHGYMTVGARRTGAEVVHSTVSDGVVRYCGSLRIAPGRLI